jgi:hypothetical protein
VAKCLAHPINIYKNSLKRTWYFRDIKILVRFVDSSFHHRRQHSTRNFSVQNRVEVRATATTAHTTELCHTRRRRVKSIIDVRRLKQFPSLTNKKPAPPHWRNKDDESLHE